MGVDWRLIRQGRQKTEREEAAFNGCAWCQKALGWELIHEETHSICPECYAEMMAELDRSANPYSSRTEAEQARRGEL